MTPFFNVVEETDLLLKDNNIRAKICVGGPHVSIMEEKVLIDAFDDVGFESVAEKCTKLLKGN